MRTLIVFLLCALAGLAADVKLTWTPSTTLGTTVALERANKACNDPAVNTSFTQIASAIPYATTSYVDANVPNGTYCYRAFAVRPETGERSVASNLTGVPIGVEPVTGLTVQVVLQVSVTVPAVK